MKRAFVVALVTAGALALAATAAGGVTRGGFTGHHDWMGIAVEGPVGQPVYETDSSWIRIDHPDGSSTLNGWDVYVAEPSMVSLRVHYAYTTSQDTATGAWSRVGAYWIAPTRGGNVIDAGRFTWSPDRNPVEERSGRWDAPNVFGGASTAPLVCAFLKLLGEGGCT